MSTRDQLLTAAKQFCTAFAEKENIESLLSHFSKTRDPVAFEHGERSLAPFIGRRFTGQAGVREYFKTVTDLISYDNMSFSNFVVDPEVRKVATKGRAKFVWLETDQGWSEEFAYVLEFDEENRVVIYEVWGDTGSAYLASQSRKAENHCTFIHPLRRDRGNR